MIIDIDGVQTNVPDRWATHYTEAQKDTVRRLVARLKEQCGDWLVSVYVFRLVRQRRYTDRFRIDGGYCTDTPESRARRQTGA